MKLYQKVWGLLSRGLPFRGYTASWAAGQVALASAFALVGSAAMAVVLGVLRIGVPYSQVWLLLTAALLLKWLLSTLTEPPMLAGARAGDTLAAELPIQSYPQADRWVRRLSVTDSDPAWHTTVVRDRAAAVVGERLWQKHAVRLAEGEPARQVLGDELYGYLTGPIDRTPSPATMSRLVTRMEEI